jgi:hypothetical protein
MGADMDMDFDMDTERHDFLFPFEPKKSKFDLFRFDFGLFRGLFRKNRNNKSVFRNKPKLKINTFDMGVDMDMDMAIFLLFRFVFGWFGYIETPKQTVSILQRNNRNKRLVSDSVETSFGSSFGYIETKLVS